MQLQVGVKVLLKREDGKILLLLRNPETYGKTVGKWDIPGGRIEPGSSLMDNLAREVREETNLQMVSTPYLIGAQDIIKEGERHVVRLTFVARTTGEPELDLNENTEYKWVTFGELRDEELLDSYVRTLLTEGNLHEDAWQ